MCALTFQSQRHHHGGSGRCADTEPEPEPPRHSAPSPSALLDCIPQFSVGQALPRSTQVLSTSPTSIPYPPPSPQAHFRSPRRTRCACDPVPSSKTASRPPPPKDALSTDTSDDPTDRIHNHPNHLPIREDESIQAESRRRCHQKERLSIYPHPHPRQRLCLCLLSTPCSISDSCFYTTYCPSPLPHPLHPLWLHSLGSGCSVHVDTRCDRGKHDDINNDERRDHTLAS